MTFPFSYTTKPPTGGMPVPPAGEDAGALAELADAAWLRTLPATLGLNALSAGLACAGCEVVFTAVPVLRPTEALGLRTYPNIHPKNKAKATTARVNTVIQGSRRAT